jgi:hypothetical protein
MGGQDLWARKPMTVVTDSKLQYLAVILTEQLEHILKLLMSKREISQAHIPLQVMLNSQLDKGGGIRDSVASWQCLDSILAAPWQQAVSQWLAKAAVDGGCKGWQHQREVTIDGAVAVSCWQLLSTQPRRAL